jgi:cytosine/uracil/thiamine/allantoin permease
VGAAVATWRLAHRLDSARARFTGGFNIKAFIAWGAAVAVRTLFTSTSIVTGPLTAQVSRIDLSFTSAAVVGGALYYALVRIFPEEGVTPDAQAYASASVMDGRAVEH